MPDKKLTLIENRTSSDYITRAYTENQNLIRLADTKANIILSLIGIILSAFFNFFVSKQTALGYGVYAVLFSFILSGIFSFLTLFPRTPVPKRSSLIYFKSSKNMNVDDELKKLINPGSGDIINIHRDFLENIKMLSKVLDKKFSYLRWAYIFLALGVILKLIIELTG